MITVDLRITIDEDIVDSGMIDLVVKHLNYFEGVTAEEIEDTYFEYNIDSDPYWKNENNT